MFCAELTKDRPTGTTPYYCLAVRDAFTVGRLDTSDIFLDRKDVSRQHATLQVSAAKVEDENEGQQPLLFPTLTLTNYSKHGTMVDGKMVLGTCTLQHGSVVSFGATVDIKIHFRPLFVTVGECYTDEYTSELMGMLTTLGATVLPAPVPRDQALAKFSPLGCFHICEEIDASPSVLRSVAFGFQLVLPAYIFEVFGAIADNPSIPLHELPPPTDFEPTRNREIYGSHHYLPPMLPNCPFSLFPLPHTGGVNRARTGLFAARVIQFRSETAIRVLGPVVRYCGGTVYTPPNERDDDDDGDEVMLRSTKTLRYVVLSRLEHELVLNEGVVDPAIVPLAQDGWQIISELTIMQSLLCNTFRPDPISLPAPPVLAEHGDLMTPDGFYSRQDTNELMSEPSYMMEMRSTDDGGGGGGKDVDSDATPSDIDTDRDDDLDEEYAALTNQRFQDAEANKVFTAHFEKLKNTMERSIVPEKPKVKEIIHAAKRHRYIGPTTVEFLEQLHERCEAQLRGLEELSTSEIGNRHSLVLQQQWDMCVEIQTQVVEAIQLGAKIGNQKARNSPYFDPHKIQPLPAMSSTESISTSNVTSPLNGISRRSADTNNIVGSGAVRESTLMVRYFPPAPVRARIHTKPPRKNANVIDDLSNARLLISIPPVEIYNVGKHRNLFLRKFGKEEGETRFSLWLTSQSPEWTTEFNRALEAKHLTLQQLLQECGRKTFAA